MKNNNYDLFLVVIASRNSIYDQMIEIYWKPFIRYLKTHNHRIKIFLIFGKEDISDLNLDASDVVISDINDSFVPGVLIKTINAFEHIEKNYEYKHILRTNLSSFFILDNLITFQQSLRDNNLYSGVIGHCNNIPFISGAGMWLSPDVIRFILNNKQQLPYDWPDDVAIGNLLNKYDKTQAKRYDLTNNVYIQGILDKIIKEGHYHIRIKNPDDRSIDIKYMEEMASQLYSS